MSPAKEQAVREHVTNLLAHYGMPASGTLHVIQEGAEPVHKTEELDPDFHAESAVIMLIPETGEFLDGKCYDAQGYEVFPQ